MTIAVDIKSGAVVGQVTTVQRPSIPEMLGLPHGPHVTILGRDGGYLTVPTSAVRIETV